MMRRRKILLSDVEIVKRLRESIEEMKSILNFNIEIIRSYQRQLAEKEKEIKKSKKKRIILR